MKDKVYSRPLTEIRPFEFDDKVADVFDNMIRRSVPGYESLLELIGVLSGKYGQPDSNCYDLGCSLGATTLQIRRHLQYSSCSVTAVDNSAAMVNRCKKILERDHSSAKVQVKCEDARETEIERASIVALNFTLQFIPPDDRFRLLKKIYDGLNSEGILILSEKVSFDTGDEQSLMTELHHAFKKDQGYSDLEIAQKRTSLENVLVPDTIQTHLARLDACGFREAFVIFRAFNFISILAVR